MSTKNFARVIRRLLLAGSGACLAFVLVTADQRAESRRPAPRTGSRISTSQGLPEPSRRAQVDAPAEVQAFVAPVAPAGEVASSTSSDRAIDVLRARDGRIGVARTSEGNVNLLSGRLSEASALPPVERARAFLREHLAVWGLADLDRDLALDASGSILSPDDARTMHVKFEQVVSGVPLLRQSLAVHIDRYGIVTAVSGEVDALAVGASLDPSPSVSSEKAIELVKAAAGKALAQEPTPIQVAYRAADGVHLAWAMNASSLQGMFSREYVIDAHDGAILAVADQMSSEVAIGVTPLGNVVELEAATDARGGYFLLDRSRPAAIYTNTVAPDGVQREWRLWLQYLQLGLLNEESLLTYSPDGYYIDQTVASDVAAHRNMAKVLDFWSSTMGRASYDGRNGSLLDAVHILDNGDPNNAFSLGNSGIQVFGDGDGRNMRSVTALDVAAHEFAHTVVAHTAQLSSGNQPGALNEHLADAFALFTERRVGNEAGQWNFLLGEEVMISRAALRNMEDPQSVANGLTGTDPDHMSLFYGGTGDGGGVHVNANILNQWAYLWLNGGTNRTSGAVVTGLTQVLGEEAAFRMGERAYYRALTTYLTPNSSFQTFRTAMLASVADLAGQDSAEYLEASSAFEAIGLP